MGGGAWPFLVGGAICLVNSVNERDLSLLTSYAEIIAIVGLQRGIPSKRESSARVDYVPALCTHRPSLLPIEWSGEVFGSRRHGRTTRELVLSSGGARVREPRGLPPQSDRWHLPSLLRHNNEPRHGPRQGNLTRERALAALETAASFFYWNSWLHNNESKAEKRKDEPRLSPTEPRTLTRSSAKTEPIRSRTRRTPGKLPEIERVQTTEARSVGRRRSSQIVVAGGGSNLLRHRRRKREKKKKKKN
ncbi:hypothetical protein LWI28_017398 [Acer negundo]|uniref:Uncharacterized protein n=1 Tax=Acer negundo TaxID=4023 RepID=A0AAD5NFS0_ACENE|nr:hypothetical protein LWI28_017398 [Acer negundo]